MGGGEYLVFPSDSFCLTPPENIVGEPLCFQKIGVWKKFMHNREVSRFCAEKNYSYSTKIIRVGTFYLSESFRHGKRFMDTEGGITFFRRKFFVSLCRKISWGNPFVFQKTCGMEKNLIRRGGGGVSRFSVQSL